MKKIKYTILTILTLLSMSSCKKFVDVNTNPNAPVAVSAAALLPSMQAGMERGLWYDSRYVSQYVQMWGSTSANNTWDQEGYVAGSDSGGEMWRAVYFSLGANTGLLWQDATAKKQWDFVGVGWAMRAWGWQTAGDEYNNMIVKEAFDPTRLTFDYDSPDAVYAEAVKDAKTALNYLNLSINTDHLSIGTTLAPADYMYYGDRTKWIKFCYGILAQNAMHLSNKSTFSAADVKRYADSSFVSNADNASVQNNGSVSTDSNFWGPMRGNMTVFLQSDYMVRLLDGRIFTNSATPNNSLDPRLGQLLGVSKDGVYRGVIGSQSDLSSQDVNLVIPYLYNLGATVNASTGVVTRVAPTSGVTYKYIYSDNSRGVLMTYPEVQFFKAEAQFISGDVSGALTTYQNAVSASIDFVSNPPIAKLLTGAQGYITPAQKAAYLAGPCVRQTAATLTLSDIMQQKYISLFVWNPLEAWSDMRRYGYSTNIYQGFQQPSPLFPDNAGKQVYLMRPRFNSEYIWNVPALQAIGALAPDYHTKKPWFILP